MADRVVSVKLAAEVGEYTASLAKAAAATRALGSSAEAVNKTTKTSMDQAGRSATQAGDKVSDSNKKIGLSADEAARRIASVRDELVQLGRANAGAGVKVDTVAARTDLEKLRAKLQEIDAAEPDARVKAETGAAEAQLRAIQSQLNRIDGQSVTANVNVDDNGSAMRATAGMQTLISTAIAVSPALIGIGAAAAAGLGAIAPLAASAGAGLGVLALGFSGVGDAVKLIGQRHEAVAADAAKSAATQVASAAQVQSAQASLANAQANAADGAISAASRVASADQNLARARQDAAESVAKAQERAASDVDSALRQQESAEKQLTTAQRSQKQAQLDLIDARKSAQQQLEDLTASVEENALSQRQSVLDVAKAKADLDKVLNDSSASDAQREQARIDYEETVLRQQTLATQGKRLAADQAEANQKGVDGSDQVVKAQERVVSANEAVSAATKAVGDAAAAIDKARRDGAAEVAKAQQDGAQKIADAQGRVADAVRAQETQQRQSAFAIEQAQRAVEAAMTSSGTAGVSALASIDAKLADVAPSTRKFAEYVDGTLKPAFERLQETAAAGLLPGVQEGLDSLLRQEPRITAFVDTFAESLGGLTRDSLENLSNPRWAAFFDMLQTQGVPQLESMWHSGDNVAEALGSIVTAFAPMATDMAAGIESLTQDFADWSAGLSTSQGFHDFEAYVRENWPKIQEIIGNVAEVIGKVIEAGAPIGAALLTGFQALTDVLSVLPVGVVKALLTAFLGYKAVQGVVGIIDGISTSFANLGDKITGVDTSATRAKGSLAQLRDVGGAALATLGTSAAIAGIEKIAGDISQVGNAGDDAKDTVNRLKDAIQNADSTNGRFQATSTALDALKQKAAEAQKVVDDYNSQNWFQKYVWHNPFGDTSDQIEAKKAAEVYGAAIDDLKGKQGGLETATQTATDKVAAQATAMADFTAAASGQLSTYQTLLSDKQVAEQNSAQATADSTANATDSWKNYTQNVTVSLDEYAAKLEEQAANQDKWRENVVTVTGRGGAEVGQILSDMGIEGANIAAQMATATDAEFQRMKDAMIANARSGGQGAKDEMQTAMNVMAQVSKDGASATAAGIAEQLGLGVGTVKGIAAQYGVDLALGINPLLVAVGKGRIATLNGQRVPDFWSGGYTGDGGKYEPKGVVHGGEFVVTKEKTARHLPLLEAIHNGELDNVPGYANGGKVGLIALGHRLQGMGARVAENPAFPPLDMRGHGATSLHYTGDAIDVNTRAGTSKLEQSELAPMAALARSLGFRTIFMAPGHYNHLHVDDGAVGGSMGSLASMPAVVLPAPPSTAPFGTPLSTGADAAMAHAHDMAQAFADASTTTLSEPSPGAADSGNTAGYRALGRQIAASMGFGNQFGAIDSVFTRESGWNPNAQNPTSSAYGIPQFLNATWAAYGGKTSDPAQQIRAGLMYMRDRYGSPNGAKAFWDSHHWYDEGGIANGVGFMAKATVEPERVLSPRQTAAFEQWMAGPHSREFSGGAYPGGGSSSSSTDARVYQVTVNAAQDPDAIVNTLRDSQRTLEFLHG